MSRRMEHVTDKKWICGAFEKKAKRSYYCCLRLPHRTVQRRLSQTVLKSDWSCRGRMIGNRTSWNTANCNQVQVKNILPLGWSNIGTDYPKWLWYCCPWKYSEHNCNCSRSAHIHDVVQILFSCSWQALRKQEWTTIFHVLKTVQKGKKIGLLKRGNTFEH